MKPARAFANGFVLALTAVVVCATPGVASAGMPSLTLTDLARLRVQTISFFLLLLLLSAAAIQGIWNGLRKDFVRLPRLTYGRSVGLVSLWGMIFLLVLTMISGARELMTPGAWVKSGATYKLTTGGDAAPRVIGDEERRVKLLALKTLLWDYARAHGGVLPADQRAAAAAIPATAWESPDPSRATYVYVPGRTADVRGDLVAYEPTAFRQPRLVLTSDGRIQALGDHEIRAALATAPAPAPAATRPAQSGTSIAGQAR